MKGLSEVTEKLNKAIAKIKGGTLEGFTDAAIFVEGESLERTPVDFGVLRKSSYHDVSMTGNTITVRIGYTAEYAPWVHEMPMRLKGQPREHFGKTAAGVQFGGGSGRGRYWDGGENKFLEKAIKFNHSEIIKLIADSAKEALK